MSIQSIIERAEMAKRDFDKSHKINIAYGEELEKNIAADIAASGFKVKLTKTFEDWDFLSDRIHGDLWIYIEDRIIKVDAKRSNTWNISTDSIKDFEGDVYIIAPQSGSLEESVVAMAKDIKAIGLECIEEGNTFYSKKSYSTLVKVGIKKDKIKTIPYYKWKELNFPINI